MIQISSEQVNMYDDSHSHNHGSGKYWEAWKYKTWRIEQLKYDPEKLLKNRDMIRYITCIGWDRAFEIKKFLKHIRDCRLSNQIPVLDGYKYWKKEDFIEESQDNSEHSKSRSITRKYKITLKSDSSTKRLKGRMLSSPVREENTENNYDDQIDFKSPEKKNKQRVGSQIFEDKKDMNEDDFIDKDDKPSESAQNM